MPDAGAKAGLCAAVRAVLLLYKQTRILNDPGRRIGFCVEETPSVYTPAVGVELPLMQAQKAG
jgi:hypothetical protein